MEDDSHNLRSVKYKLDEIFDAGKLKDMGILKKEIFLRGYEPFYEDLENEVKFLTKNELNSLVDDLERKIELAKTKSKLSSTSAIFLQHRKQLRTGIFKIFMARPEDLNTHNPIVKTNTNIVSSPAKSSVKTFHDYLIHNDRTALAGKLRDEFKTEKGKSIYLLIRALQAIDLITIRTREKKDIHASLQAFFDRDIGSYQSVFDFKYSEHKHKQDLESISKRLTQVLSSLPNQP